MQKRIENFQNGVYIRFRLQGTVIVRSTRVAGPNTVIAGLFAGGPVQVPSGAPNLSAARGSSALVIRVASQPGTRFEIQGSSDLRNWSKVSEHQVTAPTTEVQIPTRFQNQFFRAMVLN